MNDCFSCNKDAEVVWEGITLCKECAEWCESLFMPEIVSAEQVAKWRKYFYEA